MRERLGMGLADGQGEATSSGLCVFRHIHGLNRYCLQAFCLRSCFLYAFCRF